MGGDGLSGVSPGLGKAGWSLCSSTESYTLEVLDTCFQHSEGVCGSTPETDMCKGDSTNRNGKGIGV